MSSLLNLDVSSTRGALVDSELIKLLQLQLVSVKSQNMENPRLQDVNCEYIENEKTSKEEMIQTRMWDFYKKGF